MAVYLYFSDYQDFDKKLKVKTFSNELNNTIKFSMETLSKQIRS